MSASVRGRQWHLRPTRTVALTIAAVLIALVGAGLVWAAVARLSNGAWPPALNPVRDPLARNSWASVLVWTVGLVLGALGLLALVSAVVPGRRRSQLLSEGPGEQVVTDRGLARLVEARLGRLDGVEACRAEVNGSTLVVRVTTPVRNRQQIEQRVTEAVRHAVAQLPLAHPPRERVVVRVKEDR